MSILAVFAGEVSESVGAAGEGGRVEFPGCEEDVPDVAAAGEGGKGLRGGEGVRLEIEGVG